MKKLIFTLLVFTIIIAGYVGLVSNKPISNVDLAETPETIEGLIIESPVILTAKVSDKHKALNYNDEKYHLTTIKVKDLYRDQNNLISKNDDIILFQNDFADIDPLAKKNEDLLLFLVKIDVPDYENVYRAIGLYKGMFKEQESAFVNELFDNKKSLKINKKDLKSLIEANQYLPKQKKSKEELDREEQVEEQNRNKNTK